MARAHSDYSPTAAGYGPAARSSSDASKAKAGAGAGRTFFLALAALALLVAWRVRGLHDFFGLPPGWEPSDHGCMLLGVGRSGMPPMHGSEDMAQGKHGMLFISSGDLRRTFRSPDTARPGGIW